MDIILAAILGTLFGFVLQRVGASDPDKILGMLSLKDTHLMKTIFFAIGVSSVLLFVGLITGIISASHLSVKGMYWGVIIGGLLLGGGWALSGYCPGTGVVAAGAKRIDAVFFIIGGLLGAGLFTFFYESIKDTFLFEELFGGKATLVTTEGTIALINTSWSPLLAIAVGLCMVVIAKAIPASLR